MGPAVATIYGWIALWSLSGVPAGSYTMESIATESGGGTATSAPVIVTVRTSPSSLTRSTDANETIRLGAITKPEEENMSATTKS